MGLCYGDLLGTCKKHSAQCARGKNRSISYGLPNPGVNPAIVGQRWTLAIPINRLILGRLGHLGKQRNEQSSQCLPLSLSNLFQLCKCSKPERQTHNLTSCNLKLQFLWIGAKWRGNFGIRILGNGFRFGVRITMFWKYGHDFPEKTPAKVKLKHSAWCACSYEYPPALSLLR